MAAKLSGVSEISIRAWESRYSALTPDRTESNRRLYSESDIEKLILLKKLTRQGHRIGNLANLSRKSLHELLQKFDSGKIINDNRKGVSNLTERQTRIISSCIESIKKYDDHEVAAILNKALVEFSQPELIEQIILPLIEKVGEFWQEGYLRISHEHFTSALIIKFLNNLSEGFNINGTAPKIIITTPEGQYHEVGAQIGAALAASSGWKTIYLGASLPAEDIAAAAKEMNSRCIYLSIVYPDDNPLLIAQFQKLRELIGNETFIIAGGGAAEGYKKILSEIDARMVKTPKQFNDVLKSIRTMINPNNGN